MTPRVSVVMPVHNGARWLAEAIDGVLAQTVQDFELLVIDDGSNDESPRLLRDYAGRDGRVSVFRQERLGLVAALNHGIAQAHAPLLARLDADDRVMPTRLERQVAYLDAHADVGLLGSWAQAIDENGRPLGRLTPETQPEDLVRILARTNPFVHSSIVARTDILRSLGGFRAAFEAAEDYELWLRMAEVCAVANLPELLVEYRRHGGNVTRRLAMRQSFSVRLAHRAAAVRRATGRDPADTLAGPPDWRASGADASFYAEDAALYRLLDLAGAKSSADIPAGVDIAPLAAQLAGLTHMERRFAARAMLNHARHAGGADAARTRRVLFRLLSQDPRLVLRALWSLRS